MNTDEKALLSDMLDAARQTMTENWSELQTFVEWESRHILESVDRIARLKEEGRIDEDQARLQMEIQRETFISLLLTVKGVRLVQAENAVNAVMSVLGKAANRMLGWSLL